MLAVHLENGPRRPVGFALIRVLSAGICNTDLELQRGYYDFPGTPGHQFVGEVIEADTPSLIGQRVAAACEWRRAASAVAVRATRCSASSSTPARSPNS